MKNFVNFLNLFAKKIEEVYKVFNNTKKKKPKLNITNKGSLKKQVIIPMSSTNSEKFIAILNKYIANINSTLKNIKSDIVADFI